MTSALLLALLGCAADKDTEETGLESEVCDDGSDNDGDGDVDCADSDCQDEAACGSESDCADGVDNDADGATDCDDADCADDAVCGSQDEDCSDGEDNDEDGDVDCEDADCADDPACIPTDEDCSDGEDNDLDGLVDCLDIDCTDECAEDCSDSVDNDADGLVDCLDTECAGDSACLEDCTDGVDNDADGLVDCEDADCASDSACFEDCSDTVDNDADGLIDCEDDDCWGAEACLEYGAKVRLHGGGSGFIRQTKRLQSTYFADGRSTYGYTISFSNSAQFDDIEGRVRTTVEGSTVACDWSVDSVLMGRGVAGSSYSYLYGQAFGLDLVARSGFQTSGACGGLGSEFLPTKFAVASYSGIGATDKDRVIASSFTGPIWYAASMSVGYSAFSGSGGGPVSGGGYSYYISSGVNVSLSWPAGGSGDVWNP
jgi:hypothetical protein